jgi:hypothetical protein
MMYPVRDYPGYFATKSGEIWSDRTGKLKLRKPVLSSKGYYYVMLSPFRKTISVHRLIALTFLPVVENKTEVNHIDGDKLNNRVENLEWCTRSENQFHAYRIGLKKKPIYAGRIATPVVQLDLMQDFINEFSSQHEASRITGVNLSDICACCKGRYKTAGGFVWGYKK